MSDENGKSGSPWSALIFFGVLLLPGFILAWSLWGLLRFQRQRPYMIGLYTAGLALLVTLAIGVFGFVPLALSVFDDLGGFGDNWVKLIPLWVCVSLLIGAPFGFGAALFSAHQMRSNPHLVELAGDWRHNFTYKKTPIEKLRKKRKIAALRAGTLREDDKAPLGIDESSPNEDVVSRYDTEAQKHTLINGASGSGKTISMQSLISTDISNGKTVVIVDFKRSPEFASKLSTWAHEDGREFYHFVNGDPEDYDIPHSKGQCFYDPLKTGSTTSKADMVLGMREYDTASAVYKTNMTQLLGVLFRMLKFADRSVASSIDWSHGGIYQVASAVAGNNLSRLVDACTVELPPGTTKWTLTKDTGSDATGAPKVVTVNTPIAAAALEVQEELRGKSQLAHAKTELQGQMRTIVTSEYGQWMKTGNEAGDREIDLMELTSQGGNVILFSLNSDSEPDFAKFVGSMILADLTNLSANRRNAGLKNQVNIYVDEFQAVPPDSVTSLLEKARESRMALTLAQQSFDQIVASADRAGEAYLNAILDTCSNFISHAGSTEDSAVRLSKLLGKHWVPTYTKTNKNESSFLSFNWGNKRDSNIVTRDEERWIFEPKNFMALSSPDPNNGFRSTAVVVNKTTADPQIKNSGGASARTVWMVPEERVLREYYTATKREPSQRSSATEPALTLEEEFDLDNAIPRPNDEDSLTLYRESRKDSARNDSSEESTLNEEDEDDDGGYSWSTVMDDDEPAEEAFEENESLNKSSSAPSMSDVAALFENRPQPDARQQLEDDSYHPAPVSRVAQSPSGARGYSSGSKLNSTDSDSLPELDDLENMALPDITSFDR